MRTVPCRVRYTIVSWYFSPCRYLSVRRRGVIHHVPPTAFGPLRGVGRGSVCCFIRIIIHNGFMISERDESRPYAIRVVHSPVDAERDESNHAHIVLILLQSYHTNTDRMYHICNFQRNLLENVRDMYTLRQIGINIYQKTDLRQP